MATIQFEDGTMYEMKWYKTLLTISYIIASLFIYVPAMVVGFVLAEIWAGFTAGKNLWNDVQQWCAKNI